MPGRRIQILSVPLVSTSENEVPPLTAPSDHSLVAVSGDMNATTNGTTDSTSNGTTAPDQQLAPGEGKKTNTTPIIVGVVVGVVGGLALLGLLFWLWRRRRQQRAEESEKLRADPYTPGLSGGAEDAIKPTRTPISQEVGPVAPALPTGPEGAAAPAPVATQGNSPPRPFLQEEDAEDVALDVLPPRYRQRDYPEPGVSPPSTPGETPDLPLPESESPPAEQHEPGLKEEYRRAVPARPRLKQEYEQVFDEQAAGSSSAAASSSVQAVPSSAPHEQGNLKQEYKEVFGSGPDDPPRNDADAPPGQQDSLRGEYKRQFM